MKNRLIAALLALAAVPALPAWDHDGHRIINRVALAALPSDFPDFVRAPANAERVAYLANVPDRWRSVDPWLRQSGGSWTDHFLDLEELPWAGLDPQTVPSLRLDFVLAFAAGRAAHAEKFPAIDPAKNSGGTAEWPGFAPWAMAEWFHRLRSAFAYLKAFEDVGGTPEEIANAREDVVYVMGVMGHYVGDCAQPLHTTIHHNGWVGPNPRGYTKWPGFHSWIDGKDGGGLIGKARITFAEVKPRVTTVEPFLLAPRADGRDPFFVAAMDYVLAQHGLVEPLYQLERDDKLGVRQQPVAPEGRAFIEGQLIKGGEMLARVWLTAWKSAPIDAYLRTQLAKRLAPVAPPRAAAPAGK